MPDLFTYCEVELKDFIAEALITKDTLLKRVISTATESLVNDLQDMGITIDETYRHTLDNSAVRHAIKSHGSPKEVWFLFLWPQNEKPLFHLILVSNCCLL